MNSIEKFLNLFERKNVNILFSIIYVVIPLVAYKLKGMDGLTGDPRATFMIGIIIYSVIGMFHAFCLLICYLSVFLETDN
jgi:hypothetical protein